MLVESTIDDSRAGVSATPGVTGLGAPAAVTPRPELLALQQAVEALEQQPVSLDEAQALAEADVLLGLEQALGS